jgi:hypothetical protein
MDAQGPDLPRRYAQTAGATYRVLLDEEGLLASLYGFRAIPNGWVIDSDGVIRFQQIGGFDIRKPEMADAVEKILKGSAPSAPRSASSRPRREGLLAFQEGVRLLRQRRKRAAAEAWLRAAESDAANWLVRKQIWHLLYPERFEPQVDTAWQRAQLEREERLGIRSANPLPDNLA